MFTTLTVLLLMAGALPDPQGASVTRPQEPTFFQPAETSQIGRALPNLPLANLPPRPEPPDTILAIKGGHLYAVRTHQMEGNTIRYRHVMGGENVIDSGLLDSERSRKLNSDRKVPFER